MDSGLEKVGDWFAVRNVADIPSPTLLFFAERVDANLASMVQIAGSAGRLCPHVKTHKLRPLLDRQLALGIRRFKAATLAECEMAAQAGASEVLLAYQLVGPAIGMWLELVRAYPTTRFASLVDDSSAITVLSSAAAASGLRVDVLLDLDVGQHRTGVSPDYAAESMYADLSRCSGLRPVGLHAYDGHIHESDPILRSVACNEAFEPVLALRQRLMRQGHLVNRLVAGGSPTFPIHALRADVELSPGTTVLWDAGYAQRFPDLPFLPAAVLLGRVVSKPFPGRLCLDLGHKSVASEMVHPRLEFLNLPEARAVAHSEEHLVVECSEAEKWTVGDAVYALPRHICPTVALHDSVHWVERGSVVESWKVTARTRSVLEK